MAICPVQDRHVGQKSHYQLRTSSAIWRESITCTEAMAKDCLAPARKERLESEKETLNDFTLLLLRIWGVIKVIQALYGFQS